MRIKLHLIIFLLLSLFFGFFSVKNANAASYSMTASSYHLDLTTNKITFKATNPTVDFDQTDRIDLIVYSGSTVVYRTNWPNNPNCTFGSATEYHCNDNVLTSISPVSPSHSLFICMYGEFDTNTYCSQELSYSDLTANQQTINLSLYHLDTATNQLTFIATNPSINFDQTDRIDLAITNDPYIITGTGVSYRQDWPNNPSCSFDSGTEYHCNNNAIPHLGTPASTVYLCMYGEFDNRMWCSQAISYFDLITNIPNITYFNANDGTNFSRSLMPFSSGVATQTKNSDGSITVIINNTSGYADSGFSLYKGTLGDLPNFTINGTGDQFGLNLWFDTGNDNDFFTWSSNVLTGLNGDTYALGPSSSSGTTSVNGSTQFYLMSDGQNHTFSDLKSGNVSGIGANTKVAVWVGVSTNSGSKSSTINSISGL